MFHDLVPYMTNKGAGADGQHGAIGSWFWWCYPSNGGDTGGIVGSDWLTISWGKVRTRLCCRRWKGWQPLLPGRRTHSADTQGI